MPATYRNGLSAGFILALLIALFLARLWQGERQVLLHSQNLLRAVEAKNWARVAEFVAPDYTDQWGDDRALLLERLHATLSNVRETRISASQIQVLLSADQATWQARITVDGDMSDLTMAIKERVNSLASPFELEWRQMSAKPWDWKLVRVSNPDLKVPEFGE